MWEQLTPSHIVQAKTDLEQRRTEMLARHADELKSLDTDLTEIEALDRAISAFTAKFPAGAPSSAVINLEEERDLRQQSRA